MTPDLIVSRETRDRLEVYADLLLRWNRRINLIGHCDRHGLWARHICDCAQLAPMIAPVMVRAIDLGSGAGLPGLILAILTGAQFALVEADQRKAAFLREAARVTQAPITVHAMRAEALRIAPVRLVTARACAPLPRLLSLAMPLLAADGICLFPKGEEAEQELTAAQAQWHMRVERIPSRTNPDATILHLSEIQRAGDPFRP